MTMNRLIQHVTSLLFSIVIIMFTAANTMAADSWIATIGITIDQPDGNQQVVSLAFKPVKTAVYDKLVFECIYRQEMPWTDERGKPITKVIEPVTFVYRRANVKLVAELDFFCNFRAPYGYDKLTQDFGLNTFAKEGGPITIDRLRISGEIDGKRVWQYELKAGKVHEIQPEKAPEPKRQLPANTTFGEIDLD
mgnify:CR=1 FL=1